MKNIYIFLYSSFLWLPTFAQNTSVSPKTTADTQTLSDNVNVFFNAGVYGDTVVHIVWENYDQNNIKEVILESSTDGISFSLLSKAIISTLTDIHSNNYPVWIDYYDHILMSTESGNTRFIFNDMVANQNISQYPRWYRVKMLTFSGYVHTSQIISTAQEQVNNNQITGNGENLINTDESLLKGGTKSGCNPIGTPPSGYTATNQTQTYYEDCCYWVETLYQSTGPVQTNCGGNSYAWCCNNVPGASGCASGYVSDPCCVHYCNQYSQCSCHPWQCCTQSTVSQWVVTQSVNYTAISLTPNIQNETCSGMFDGSITVTVNNGTAPYTYAWSNSGNTATITGLAGGTYSVTVTDVHNCQVTGTYTVNSNPGVTPDAGPNQSICLGQSATLIASGGASYHWSTNQNTQSITVSPTATTTYIVTVSSAIGCSATDNVTVTVITVPANAGTDQIICYGQNANLTAFGGVNYHWSDNSNNQSTNVSPTTTTTYTVTVTDANGCSATDDVLVTVNNLPPANAGTDQAICFGSSANLSASGGITYSWSPSIGLSNPNIFNPVANPQNTTTYTVTVTDGNGCSATDNMILTVNPLPVANAGPDQSICIGFSANLNASNGTAYLWSPAGSLNNPNIFNPTATPTTTTTYIVMVSDVNGCTQTDDVIVTVNPIPTFTYVTDSVNCHAGSDGSITLTPSGGSQPYSYVWSPSVSSGAVATNLVAGTYYVTITDNNGCDTTGNFVIYDPPQLTLSTSGNVTICNSQSTTISATATGGVGSYTFIWDNGLGTGSSFTVNPTTTTTYTVSVTDGNACTTTPQTLTVTVLPSILVNVISNPAFICYGGTAVLTATPNGGNGNYIYTWGQGIGVSSQSITVVPVTTTMYPVTVTDNCGSPQGVDSVEVIVYPLPTVQFTSDTISGCEPLVITFADSSTPAISTWLWDFGNIHSGINNNSTQQNPTHIYFNAGTYTVTLTVTTTNGCTGSYTHQNMIIVFPSPDANFIMHPDVGSTQNPKITFIDLSTNASTWSWNFGEFSGSNNTSNDQNPQHSYESAGIFTVTLVVESPYGCVDSTSNEIWIKQDFAIFFPNAFTPNGDSKNDGFRPEGAGIDPNSYQLYIYNRWGEMIFKTNDFYEYWDGKVMGSDKMAEVAVYSWIAFMKDVNGESYTFRGRITLIK